MIRLVSSEMCHTPGIVRMAQNEYHFKPQWAIDFLAEAYFRGARAPARHLLENPDKVKIVEDTVEVHGINASDLEV